LKGKKGNLSRSAFFRVQYSRTGFLFNKKSYFRREYSRAFKNHENTNIRYNALKLPLTYKIITEAEIPPKTP
jgi:hypothetical protein